MPGDDRSTPHGQPVRSPNRGRLPTRVKTARANLPFIPQERQAAPPEQLSERAKYLAGVTTLTRADLATGRGLTYEWEFFVDQLFRRLAEVGSGGGTGGGGSQTFEFSQSNAASVWTVNHGLFAYPTVLVIDDSGQELLAELHYPNDQTVVIIHGQPYSGTAYLRN